MPSERRLHPASILFGLGAQLRAFAVPAVLVLVTAGSAGWDWQVWMPPLLIPSALVSVLRYFSFRYRYEPNEMVIRTGFLFRNERHVPYARIQNLDAVQNVLHRVLGVVEVRVETGGGEEPEATMSVLRVADYEEMRRRVFEQRGEAPAQAERAGAPAVSGRTLLQLRPRELALHGLIQNRGGVVLAAAFGVVWELGLVDGFLDRIFDKPASGRGAVRELLVALFGRGEFPLSRIALGLAALAGFLLLVRGMSVIWALVRLHGFRVTRAGEDLRTEFGLFTRVVATIPLRRIQTLTILEGPLHRLFGRQSVRVQTAGGGGGEESKTQREWLAPILRRGELPGFLSQVLPEAELAGLEWYGPAPRAFRRELKGSLFVVGPIALALVGLLRWWGLALSGGLVAWAYVHARLYVAHLAWAVGGGAVWFRRGWYWRRLSVARFAKIQVVALRESPFDRRAAMARVAVDTAGAGDSSQGIDIPYLARTTARELHELLTLQAAGTAFRW
jgi:putative membrane protein